MSSHQFRGQPAPRQRRRAGFSQASTRRGITLYDQHDREWTAMVSLKSGMPTGRIVPNFRAPWVPDQQYLRVNPDNTSELWIDYDVLLRQRRARLEEYHKLAVQFAREKKLGAPERGLYSDQIQQAIGSPPRAIEPVVAAMQGNVYILGEEYAAERGVRYAVDPRLERFVSAPVSTDSILGEFDFGPRSFAEAKAATEALTSAAAPATPAAPEAEEDEEAEQDFAGFDAAAEGEDDGEDEGEGDNTERILSGLDEDYDPEAMGGQTIAPKNAERAARQAPRRGNASPVRSKHGAARSAARKAQRGHRPTLADGAAPVIGE